MNRKPDWLKRKVPAGRVYQNVHRILREEGLHTVCQQALCPNMWECFSRNTATFLILGNRCTRNCCFCAVLQGPKQKPDPREPQKIAKAVRSMGLEYVVITSVTRDDLADGGADHFASTIEEIRSRVPGTLVEVLIPDFNGSSDALKTLLKAAPDVVGHNVETVPELYQKIRPKADYRRSLDVLKKIRELSPGLPTKTGIMLGFGESSEQVKSVFYDILSTECGIITIGQYLQPSDKHFPVKRFIPPEEFKNWQKKALGMGFQAVVSGPLVRSSYNARGLYNSLSNRSGMKHRKRAAFDETGSLTSECPGLTA